MLLKDHYCLECVLAIIVLLKDHCLECVGKNLAAERSLFGVHVSKHRAAEGSFLFAASVTLSHE